MLYGDLGRDFGKVHRLDVKNPAEAVRALCVLFKGFRDAINPEAGYRVIVGGEDRNKDTFNYPSSDAESIRIVPVIQGAGDGFGQVLLGAALIAVSVFVPVAPAFVGNVGLALALGGVSQMLFAPQASSPDQYEKPENRPSFFFNGAVNTSREGNCVPICYGRMIVGSQVISTGLSVEQI